MTREPQREDEDRAVSEIISVLLLVAIAVIMAGVVGSVLVGQIEAPSNPEASASFQRTGSDVTVQIVQTGNIDSISIQTTGSCDTASSVSSVGDTATIGNCSTGDRISVIGTLNGESSVVARYDFGT